MMEFTVLKTKVKISPLFFAVLTAFLITDRNGIAPAVIGFSLVHEFCHFAALAAIKTAPQEVNVSAAGISMSLNGGMSTVKKILVLAAGAAGNFVLAAFFSAADNRLFFTVNLIIGIFTILPLCSTDGGTLLTALPEKICRNIFLFCGATAAVILASAVVINKNPYLLIALFYAVICLLKY